MVLNGVINTDSVDPSGSLWYFLGVHIRYNTDTVATNVELQEMGIQRDLLFRKKEVATALGAW